MLSVNARSLCIFKISGIFNFMVFVPGFAGIWDGQPVCPKFIEYVNKYAYFM